MNERIDQFCEILRVKLTSIDDNMRALKAKIDSKERTVEQDVQFRLDSVKKRIAQDRTKLEAAQADIKKWAEERKAATDEKIAEWKEPRSSSGFLPLPINRPSAGTNGFARIGASRMAVTTCATPPSPKTLPAFARTPTSSLACAPSLTI